MFCRAAKAAAARPLCRRKIRRVMDKKYAPRTVESQKRFAKTTGMRVTFACPHLKITYCRLTDRLAGIWIEEQITIFPAAAEVEHSIK
jgi:hypothetical protein